MKKLREESEASVQKIDFCEDYREQLQEDTAHLSQAMQKPHELKHDSVMIGELQKGHDRDILEEMYQELKDQSCYRNLEFLEGNNHFSKLEFRVMNFSKDMSFDVASNGMSELMGISFDPIDIGINSFRAIPVSSLKISGAHDMFDEMLRLLMGNWVFNPGDFIDSRLARKSGFELQEVSVMEAAIVNHNKKDSNKVCKTFSWEMEDNMVV